MEQTWYIVERHRPMVLDVPIIGPRVFGADYALMQTGNGAPKERHFAVVAKASHADSLLLDGLEHTVKSLCEQRRDFGLPEVYQGMLNYLRGNCMHPSVSPDYWGDYVLVPDGR